MYNSDILVMPHRRWRKEKDEKRFCLLLAKSMYNGHILAMPHRINDKVEERQR
jgi:hypothetical protein